MNKFNVKYAMYYNYAEKRYGSVFQYIFRSEAVEDDEYKKITPCIQLVKAMKYQLIQVLK